jgi:hypothetical protein
VVGLLGGVGAVGVVRYPGPESIECLVLMG